MSASLKDFSSDELQTLLNVVVTNIVEEDEHKKEWCKMFGEDKDGVPWESELYYDETIRPIRGVNYEHLCLWRVQILDAIGKVGSQQIVNSN
jgi:hypothetical protein